MNLTVIERITQRSSAHEPMCGNRLLTSIPLFPYRLNSHGLGKMAPLLLNIVRSTGIGIGRPASCVSRGFGSNESTCETPPDI
jgi:hypothetical protein